MPRFRFRFATLLKLRENERRQRQIELAQALEAERLLKSQAESIAAEISTAKVSVRNASSPGEVPVDSLLELQRYSLQLAAQAAAIAEQLGRIRAEVDRRRQIVVEADRQVRTLEKLRDKQAEAFRSAAEQEEQKRIDEIAQKTGGDCLVE
jgi:flagellar FliJ protein